MKTLLVAFLLCFASGLTAPAQVQTLIANNYGVGQHTTNANGIYFASSVLNVPTNGFATLKSASSAYGVPAYAQLQITTQGATFLFQPISGSSGNYGNTVDGLLQPLVIAGPATIQLLQVDTGNPNNSPQFNVTSMATFDVQPTPFPPNKTLTVGAYSGNVQVTMQMSTDLVNWTPAVNAQIYTNSPDARFFRIQLVTNVGP